MKRILLLTMAAWCAAAFAAEGADDDGMAAAREALLAPAEPPPRLALPDTTITAKRMEYNYKEAVAILTDDVVVDDARFRLTSDRLFVFLDGTNSLSQLVVVGNVAVSNENRRAYCDKAVYTHADGRLVMVGDAKLSSLEPDGSTRNVKGDKITIWTNEERMEVYPNPELTFPAGAAKDLEGLRQ